MADTRKHFNPEDTLFTGVRYVASDDIWLSPQNGRDNAVISFIVLGDRSRTGNHTEFDLYAQGLERICSEKYQGATGVRRARPRPLPLLWSHAEADRRR